MKLKDVLQECMLIVGGVVGVSFVTGKESQAFVGNSKNIVIFAVIFCFSTALLRLYCHKNSIQSTQQFAQFAFKKWGHVVHFTLLGCYFVCLVTTLATVQSCMEQLIAKTTFSIWSFGVALVSFLIAKKDAKWLKALSTMAFVGAFVTFLFVSTNNTQVATSSVKPLWTLLYSLFSLTMILPVCCRLKSNNPKQTIIGVVVATIAIALLLWWVQSIADFSLPMPIGQSLHGLGKVCLCTTICLCGVLGTVCNTLPICKGICDILPSQSMQAFVVIALGWAFSCFGLDLLLKYGYLFVALVGLAIVATCFRHIFCKKNPR